MQSSKKKAVKSGSKSTEQKELDKLDRKLMEEVTTFFKKDLQKCICNKFKLGNQSISYGIMQINENYAKMLLASNKQNNRNISKVNLTKIEQAMKSGDFMSLNGQNIVIAVDSRGSIRLIDGQHRMQAILSCGIPYWFQVTMVENASEELFISMDSGKSRNTADHLFISDRNPKLGTTLRVGYGYATNMPINKTVTINDILVAKIYDKNPDLEPLYTKISDCVRSTKPGGTVVADKLFFDQAIYFAMYMINDNFGREGKQFIKALISFTKEDMDAVSLTKSQRSTITHLQWLFNGVNRGFEDLCIKHRVDFFSSDTRPKRLRRSLFLVEAFIEYFLEDKVLNKSKSISILTDTEKLTAWPDMGEFPI